MTGQPPGRLGFIALNSPLGEPRLSQVWRDSDGVHSTIWLGDSTIHFNWPGTLRALAAVCTQAADAMDALPPPEAGAS